MGRRRHTPEQIITALREAEVGLANGKSVAEVARQLGISEQTCGIASATRLALRGRSAQPRHREVTSSGARDSLYRGKRHTLLERLARDQPVIDALQAVVAENTRWGFWKCFDRLRNQGRRWNHKRVHRVYCALRFNLPRRTKRRVPRRVRYPLAAPPTLNHTWAIDFMTDTLYDGRRFRTLNVIDEGNREGLALEVGMSLPSARVIAILDELVAMHDTPRALRVDNGPELTSIALNRWCARSGVALHYIQPGKPQQNAYIERFNRTYRTEVLNAYVFQSIAEVRSLSTDWLIKYNTQRPHDSLGRVPPLTFLPRPTAPSESTLQWSA